MSERTALEIASRLEALMPIAGESATKALRAQHAEIARLKRERHHIYDLLARIHRDGGQYTAEHGVEKACDELEAMLPGTKTGNTLQWASEKIRARGKS